MHFYYNNKAFFMTTVIASEAASVALLVLNRQPALVPYVYYPVAAITGLLAIKMFINVF